MIIIWRSPVLDRAASRFPPVRGCVCVCVCARAASINQYGLGLGVSEGKGLHCLRCISWPYARRYHGDTSICMRAVRVRTRAYLDTDLH